jgi:thiol-disulfide isomerase/thioredoxin
MCHRAGAGSADGARWTGRDNATPMLSVSLGPLALPVAPLLLLLCAWLASWTASRVALRRTADPVAANRAGGAVTRAVVAGLIAARLAHLAVNADLYARQPLAMVDLRDGGWNAAAGWVVALTALAWVAIRRGALRWPLTGGAALGIAAWAAATAALGVHAGQALPSLALTRLDDGAATDLRQAAQGRPLVVNLWASWCGPCRQEMPTLAAAQQREAKVAFVFVNQGEPEAIVRAYVDSLGLPLRAVLLDPGSTFGPLVGSRGLPTTLFYDARGRLVAAHFGVLNGPALHSRLRALRPTP